MEMDSIITVADKLLTSPYVSKNARSPQQTTHKTKMQNPEQNEKTDFTVEIISDLPKNNTDDLLKEIRNKLSDIRNDNYVYNCQTNRNLALIIILLILLVIGTITNIFI
jgi:hypothetical protein